MKYPRVIFEIARKKISQDWNKIGTAWWFFSKVSDALTVYEKLGDWKKIEETYGKEIKEIAEWILEDLNKQYEELLGYEQISQGISD